MVKKEWTVIMYLNGNNELGIEMENTFNEVCKIKDNKDVNIVMQLSKANTKLLNLIRQDTSIYKEEWFGSRTYSLVDGNLRLHRVYDKLNMADYKTLYNFIEWSVKNFPAERYMLVISGHGFIVAELSDLCGDNPYIMGMYEMCTAINNVKRELDLNIDILALDICNMNTVELIYELGKNKLNTVKYVLTYINDGPLDGMDFNNIVDKLNEESTEIVLKDIVDSSPHDVIGVKIKHGKLEKIKTMSNELSYKWLLINEKENNEEDIRVYNYLHSKIEEVINKLIVCKNNREGKKSLIHLMFYNKYQIVDIESFTKFYYKLSFTKNNYCSNLIGKKPHNYPVNMQKSVLEQEYLDIRDIELFISNFNEGRLDEKKVSDIANEVFKLNNWKLK